MNRQQILPVHVTKPNTSFDELAQWGAATGALDIVRAFAEHPWIVNSRNTADEDVVRTLASLAGFTPDIQHKIDSLDLVQDLIASGLGVALIPSRMTPRACSSRRSTIPI